jgi:hypothetical protein
MSRSVRTTPHCSKTEIPKVVSGGKADTVHFVTLEAPEDIARLVATFAHAFDLR